MNDDEHESGSAPLIDEDETLDFLLYQEMSRESQSPLKAGCLGVAILCVVPPAVWLACRWL